MTTENVTRQQTHARRRAAGVAAFMLLLLLALVLGPVRSSRADEPFARSRQYDLQNARIELRFDLDQRKVIGQVTHTLAALRDGLKQLDFDSVGLTISSVRVNGKDAHFSTDSSGLHVDLAQASKVGEKYDVAIRYEGKPKRGLYWVFPDKSDPTQPKEIWTQGEAEDTRYYIPIYDYPNDRTTSEMIVTVPSDWITVSNGKLESVTEAALGLKTWTWRQSEPVSTYLISLVAGEFEEKKSTWRNIPVDFYVPRGRSERIEPTFARTRDMLTFFSDRTGVPYPWDKFDQTMVDRFVEGGMENVSAVTLTTRDLLLPVLAQESLEGADNLVSHEMSHQWFGDLVTCKDWANLWLNEGFATFMATLWEEHQYGPDNAAYSRWRDQAMWFRQVRMYGVPIVTRDFTDSMEYAGNIYTKAGLVLQMLRERMGDDAFFKGLQHYLEENRLQNVVTADLVKALEESSHTNLDDFFDEWIYGAGAPRFDVTADYDAAAKQVSLDVKQMQNVNGRVGLFHVPMEIAVTTASGTKDFPISISKADEKFSFPADSEPLMILFDKGNKVLKTVNFQKSSAQWIYQLKNAQDVPDRADAAQALGAIRGNEAVVAALSEAALHDPFWGVRVQVLNALGRIASPDAEKGVLAAMADPQPLVREAAATQLGKFHDDDSPVGRLTDISRTDSAYRVRAAALSSVGEMHTAPAFETLEAAARTESPDDVIRRAALRAMGVLNDDRAVSMLLEWSQPGKPEYVRESAIDSLGRIDKKNVAVESALVSYLFDSDYEIRDDAVEALGERGDPAAIAPLEALVNSGELAPDSVAEARQQIARLRNGGRGGRGSADGNP